MKCCTCIYFSTNSNTTYTITNFRNANSEKDNEKDRTQNLVLLFVIHKMRNELFLILGNVASTKSN